MYAKLFGSILDSSLWSTDLPTRILFLTMLAMADREGRIFSSRAGLRRRALLMEDDFKRALEDLLAADPESSDLTRNPEKQGRRIEKADGGWLVINYAYYRDLQDEDERRSQTRERVRRHRARAKRRRSVTLGNAAKRRVTKSNESNTSESESESYKRNTRESAREETPRDERRPGNLDDVRSLWQTEALLGDPELFFRYHEDRGWKWKSWKRSAKSWSRREATAPQRSGILRGQTAKSSEYDNVPQTKVTNA